MKSEESDYDDFLMDRMEEYLESTEDPWGVDFEMSMLEDEGIPLILTPYSDDAMRGIRWSAEQHAGRVRFLMSRAGADQLSVPIEVDCACDRGHIYADPVILDGWHRYMAHRALDRKTICVSFGGRVDLKEYLRGDRDDPPEE